MAASTMPNSVVGNVDDVDAPVVHRRREPGDVGDDTAAHAHDGIGAPQSGLGEAFAQPSDRVQTLGLLAVTDQVDRGRHAGSGRPGGIRDAGLRDEGNALRGRTQHGPQFMTRPATDDDWIAALAQFHRDRDHSQTALTISTAISFGIQPVDIDHDVGDVVVERGAFRQQTL